MSDTLAVERLRASYHDHLTGNGHKKEVSATGDDSECRDGAIGILADPTLAEALSTGLALMAVQEALPERWRLAGVSTWRDRWRAYANDGSTRNLVGEGDTIASAALALVDALNKEKGR